MFAPHGTFDLSITGNLIHIKLIGSFNEQGAIRYVNEVKRLVESIGESGFKVLIEADKFEGATPEAYQISGELNLWLREKKIIAKAITSASTLKSNTAVRFEPHIMAGNVAIFTTVSSAKEWLLSIK